MSDIKPLKAPAKQAPQQGSEDEAPKVIRPSDLDLDAIKAHQVAEKILDPSMDADVAKWLRETAHPDPLNLYRVSVAHKPKKAGEYGEQEFDAVDEGSAIAKYIVANNIPMDDVCHYNFTVVKKLT